MEYFGADDRKPVEVCLEKVRDSNLYIGIVGHRYGSIVPDTNKSYTHTEYEEARRIGRPCLIYLKSDKLPILPQFIEKNPESMAKLSNFKDTLLREHKVCYFDDIVDLIIKIMTDLCKIMVDGLTKSQFKLKADYLLSESYRGGHYPYEVGAAGRLRGYFRTMRKTEALVAEPHIVSLAKELLPERRYEKAETLSKMLVGSEKDSNAARIALARIVVPPPKRPIYYCKYEMQFLPYKSRDILRDMGDFVDMLVKAAVYERTNSAKVFDRTLAQTIGEFEKYFPSHPQLLKWLSEFNQFLFTPRVADERIQHHGNKHRFTLRETVLVILVAMHLANKITAISRMAELVRQDKPMRT
jgi:hypothetical protein